MGTMEYCPYSAQSGTERNTRIDVASRTTASRGSLTHHRNGALIASRPRSVDKHDPDRQVAERLDPQKRARLETGLIDPVMTRDSR